MKRPSSVPTSEIGGLIDHLIARKNEAFASDHRSILSCKVTMNGDQLHLRAAGALID